MQPNLSSSLKPQPFEIWRKALAFQSRSQGKEKGRVPHLLSISFALPLLLRRRNQKPLVRPLLHSPPFGASFLWLCFLDRYEGGTRPCWLTDPSTCSVFEKTAREYPDLEVSVPRSKQPTITANVTANPARRRYLEANAGARNAEAEAAAMVSQLRECEDALGVEQQRRVEYSKEAEAATAEVAHVKQEMQSLQQVCAAQLQALREELAAARHEHRVREASLLEQAAYMHVAAAVPFRPWALNKEGAKETKEGGKGSKGRTEGGDSVAAGYHRHVHLRSDLLEQLSKLQSTLQRTSAASLGKRSNSASPPRQRASQSGGDRKKRGRRRSLGASNGGGQETNEELLHMVSLLSLLPPSSFPSLHHPSSWQRPMAHVSAWLLRCIPWHRALPLQTPQ